MWLGQRTPLYLLSKIMETREMAMKSRVQLLHIQQCIIQEMQRCIGSIIWNHPIFQKLQVLEGSSNKNDLIILVFTLQAISFHPNGNYVATGSADKTVRLWCVSTGQQVRLFPGHRGSVHCLAFSPDGKLIASAGKMVYPISGRLTDISINRRAQTLNLTAGDKPHDNRFDTSVSHAWLGTGKKKITPLQKGRLVKQMSFSNNNILILQCKLPADSKMPVPTPLLLVCSPHTFINNLLIFWTSQL